MEALKTSGMTLYNVRHNNKKHEKCRKMPPIQTSQVCTKHSSQTVKDNIKFPYGCTKQFNAQHK